MPIHLNRAFIAQLEAKRDKLTAVIQGLKEFLLLDDTTPEPATRKRKARKARRRTAAAAAGNRDTRRLNPRQAARFLDKSPQTLAGWRVKKLGPKFTKEGSHVWYEVADLEAYQREPRHPKVVGEIPAAS